MGGGETGMDRGMDSISMNGGRVVRVNSIVDCRGELEARRTCGRGQSCHSHRPDVSSYPPISPPPPR